MAFKSEAKQIGAYTYKVTQLDAIRGRRAAVRLGKVIAPALDADSISVDSIGKMLAKALGSLTEDDFDYFCDLLSAQTSVKGPGFKGEPQLADVFATHFADRYADMVQWLAFALKVQFGSFFGENGQLLERLAGQSNSIFPTTPTGSSGDS